MKSNCFSVGVGVEFVVCCGDLCVDGDDAVDGDLSVGVDPTACEDVDVASVCGVDDVDEF